MISQSTLTTVQQCVANALGAGATMTDAAETYGINRVTVYRWMKTHEEFKRALYRARGEFILARRDDLHHLSNRALETLLSILDNPRSSPAVLLRTSMFILQRPMAPKTGWTMPEPAPPAYAPEIVDSCMIEQGFRYLPGLEGIERDQPENETECNAMQHESGDSEDVAPAADAAVEPQEPAAECNEMQHDSGIHEVVATPTTLRSCPAPPEVREARNQHEAFLHALDLIKSVETVPPALEEETLMADSDEIEEILA